MGDAMAAADVVVSRAGATSLAEISARALPALLVPFPFATEDHQTMNAQACVEAGAAYLVADADVEGPEFARKLCELIEDEDVRARMAAAAARRRRATPRVCWPTRSWKRLAHSVERSRDRVQ